MGLGQTRQQLYSPALFCGHSWSYDGPIENILLQIDSTCPNIYFARFSWSWVKQNQRHPLLPTFWATLGPMVCRSKIYCIKSTIHVLICILFDFHGARSNKTRDILFGPLSGPVLVYGGLQGRPIKKSFYKPGVSHISIICTKFQLSNP